MRRRGITLIYTALGLGGFMGITALVVDMGQLYTRRAQAQRAADAAALAGALELPKGTSAARATAIEYARLNGYDDRSLRNPATITVTFSSSGGAGSASSPDRLRVAVQRNEALYFLPAFAALLGQSASSSKVGAAAVAEGTFKTSPIETPLLYGAEYGKTQGSFANPSVFGQDGLYEHGDAYSPRFLSDGTTRNTGTDTDPRGDDFNGYEYSFNIGDNYVSQNGTSQVQLEIFDPDSHVSDLSNMLGSWDELHRGPSRQFSYTTTTYSLFDPRGNLIAESSYGDDASTNLKWTTPAGFTFDIASHGGPGKYTLRVKSGAGTSENGFQLRAGKPHEGLQTQEEEAAWVRDYNAGGAGNGTSLTSRGRTVINFTKTGPIEINLGYVPKKATKVIIDKFDTDVGFQSMAYTIKRVGPGNSPSNEAFTPDRPLPPASQAMNGRWASDVVDVPRNYPPEGAYWFVSYSAGAFDTSNWLMRYSALDGDATSTVQVRLVD